MAHLADKALAGNRSTHRPHPLDVFMESSLGVVFPAAVLLVQQGGRTIWHRAYGWHDPGTYQIPTKLDSMFDLASLTKLFSATAFMRLVEAGKVRLETPVADVLPAFHGERIVGNTEDPLQNKVLPADPRYAGQRVYLEKICFRHLLTHTSGLAAWRSLYSIGGVVDKVPPPHQIPTRLRARRVAAVYQYDFAYPTGEELVYSDLGFILLGEVIQSLSGMSLEETIQREVGDLIGLKRTVFNPIIHGVSLSNVVPTEFCGWRHRRLVGEVDDENAASLSGVSGHAGLFSTAEEVARLGQVYLEYGRFGDLQVLSHTTVAEMIREQVRRDGQRRGLTWVLQTPKGCSCGSRFGPRSFGHTGFTGTSLWVDPDRDLVVVALTNRVYFGRSPDEIERFRPALHDLVIETLVEQRK